MNLYDTRRKLLGESPLYDSVEVVHDNGMLETLACIEQHLSHIIDRNPDATYEVERILSDVEKLKALVRLGGAK